MAGAGSRFVTAGYKIPKPFIDVNGKSMIVRVLDNLSCADARYILIARKDHLEKEKKLVTKIKKTYDAIFIPIDQLTEGAASTVLFSRELIDNDDPLIIANSDQIVDIVFQDYVDDCFSRKLDGLIMTFQDIERNPKWSFARIDNRGYVQEVREKVVISDIATVGIYMFTHGREFVDFAIDMIVRNDRVNNEFYVCPIYNYAIKAKKKIGIYDMEYEKMHGIFMAKGPNILSKKIPSFENIHIYPFLATILRLKYPENIDGHINVLGKYIKE